MNLLKQQKERESKAQAEQMEMAKKMVEIANEVMELLKAKELKVYECDLIANLLKQRIKENADAYVGSKLLSELYAKKEEEKS